MVDYFPQRYLVKMILMGSISSCMGHTHIKTFLFFIWNSNLTEHTIFYLAALIMPKPVPTMSEMFNKYRLNK